MYLNKRKEKSMKKISVVLIAAWSYLCFLDVERATSERYRETTLSVWYWGEQEVPGIRRIWKRW